MTDSVIQAFAKHLSGLDEAGVARAGRAKLLALNDVPEETFEPPVTTLGDCLDTPSDPSEPRLADHRGSRRDHGDTRPRRKARRR